MQWERIDETTERARVPGGWLVRQMLSLKSSNSTKDVPALAMAFVPDLYGVWSLESPPTKDESERDNEE